MTNGTEPMGMQEGLDPFSYARRETVELTPGSSGKVGTGHPPRVITRVEVKDLVNLARLFPLPQFAETPAEGLLVRVNSVAEISGLPDPGPSFYVLELAGVGLPELQAKPTGLRPGSVLLPRGGKGRDALRDWLLFAREHHLVLAADVTPAGLSELERTVGELGEANLIVTLSQFDQTHGHALGAWRGLAARLRLPGARPPLWIRNTPVTSLQGDPWFLHRLLDAAILTGALLCDGLGDLVSIETEADPARATTLAYNILQGAGVRSSKTEFVACPSCGRTLFDLQTTTQRIRARTGHLKGVKIAIMGCIVNGPGEMADADFGYVGGAPGKINLYVGKNCVLYNLPQAEADDRLVALIRAEGRWAEPPAPAGDIPVTAS
jgi:(E)-4-hydroxy-3-methylbut-2-enyl-diphosphate synthase